MTIRQTFKNSEIDSAIEFLRQHTSEEGCYDITIQKLPSGRSNKLNRYYRVIIAHQIIAIQDQWGIILNAQQMHYINKNTFFAKYDFDFETGEIVKTEGSTTSFDNKSFSFILEHIRQYFFLHFSYNIPDPE